MKIDELKRAEERIANFTKHFFDGECPAKCDSAKGCCKDCDLRQGFLDSHLGVSVFKEGFSYSPLTPDWFLRKLKKKYDFETTDGFWTEKGCKLPRKHRSVACLVFGCEPIKKEYEDFEMVMSNLGKLLLDVRERKFELMEEEDGD